jgi:hypothetical protein
MDNNKIQTQTEDASMKVHQIHDVRPETIEADIKGPQSVHDEKKCTTPNVVELPRHETSSPITSSAWTFRNSRDVIFKFAKFMGPGAIITIAYIDPDNFQTAISAGAQFKYKLLFMILLSNIIAIYLQVSR